MSSADGSEGEMRQLEVRSLRIFWGPHRSWLDTNVDTRWRATSPTKS